MNWISVEDRLPKEDEPVLAFCRNGFTGDVYNYSPSDMPHQFVAEYTGNVFYCSHTEYYSVKANIVTHWMPLPEQPTNNTSESS